MRISVLTENFAGSTLKAEHGLSYFIETDKKRILFDTGQSDLFIRNSRIMNVDLEEIDMIILSHGHFDHGNGLEYLHGYNLLCHPGCFARRYRKADNEYIGLKNSRDELASGYNLITSIMPVRIAQSIYFLGEIPRLTEFESQRTSFIFEDGTPDFVMDDSALAVVLPEGLFVFTGCGHAGIVNILEHARKVTGAEDLYGIMGGFHLKDDDSQLAETIRYLRGNNVKYVLPSHCTGLPALASFYGSFGSRQLRTGDIMSF